MTLKSKIKLGFLGLAVILLLILAFCGGKKVQYQESVQTEKLLRDQRDSLEAQIKLLTLQCKGLNRDKQELQQEILNLQNDIEFIEKKYNEKIASIRTYSNPELERFFTKRYGHI